MDILIIGSKGFIGKNCADYFSVKGHRVSKADINVDYNDSQYFQVDATNASYDEIFEQSKFDACINCSGAASVPDSLIHPFRDFHLNTHNVFTILEAIRKHNRSCRFINLSSAAVYGNPQSLPVDELSPRQPVSPYGQHKLYAEMIADEFCKYFGLQTCSVRIFSAYGPGLQKQLFWDLYKKSLTASAIELFGTGSESRDFIFIEDIMLGIERVLVRGVFDGRSYNLGSGVETSIRDAVSTFFSCLGKHVEVKFQQQNRAGDPLNWRANVGEIGQLGFAPQYSLQQGITKYIQWVKEIA